MSIETPAVPVVHDLLVDADAGIRAAAEAVAAQLTNLALGAGVEAFVFDPAGALLAQKTGVSKAAPVVERSTIITDFLNSTTKSGVPGFLGNFGKTLRDIFIEVL